MLACSFSRRARVAALIPPATPPTTTIRRGIPSGVELWPSFGRALFIGAKPQGRRRADDESRDPENLPLREIYHGSRTIGQSRGSARRSKGARVAASLRTAQSRRNSPS